MFLGDSEGLALQITPKGFAEWKIFTARSEAFEQERLETRVLFALLGFAKQGPEVLAHIAVTLRGELLIDERLQGFG